MSGLIIFKVHNELTVRPHGGRALLRTTLSGMQHALANGYPTIARQAGWLLTRIDIHRPLFS